MILSNGTRLLARWNTENEIVAVRIMFKTGSRYERSTHFGVSNLALRMLLKGTGTRSAERIADDLDAIGAHLDVGVEKDVGGLMLQCAAPVLDEALEILWDVTNSPVFARDQVRWEKQRIKMEILEDEDSPMTYTFKQFIRNLYGEHPYGAPSKGYPETLSKLTADRVSKHYRKCLSSREMVIAAVGHLDIGRIVRWLDERFGVLPIAKRELVEPDDSSLGTGSAVRHTQHRRRVEAENLVMGYLAPSLLSPDFPVMKVLDSILGSSMDSRLFIEVRDKRGLAYSVGSSYVARKGPGALCIYFGTDPSNHEQALSQCQIQVQRLQQELVPDDELHRARQYLQGLHVMSLETNMGQAEMLSSSVFFGLGSDYVSEYPQLIGAVTAEDVRRVAQQYLTDYASAVTTPSLLEDASDFQ